MQYNSSPTLAKARSDGRNTRSSATADGPRDATCQSQSCQLLLITVSEQLVRQVQKKIEAMELEGYSRRTYNKLVYSAAMRSTVVGVSNKLNVDEFVGEIF